jgi:AAA domain-containing protein
MRIAVSGTHCTGKSTLIDEFLLAHPDFVHEPEPYTALQDDYGEVFSAEPCEDDFYRQLEFNVERLRSHRVGERVIFERCPADFVAYLLALRDLGRGANSRATEEALGLAKQAIVLLDLIVFLPLDDKPLRVMAESEDRELRCAVDRHLIGILCDDEFGFFNQRNPMILEARGSTAGRLRTIEATLEARPGSGDSLV